MTVNINNPRVSSQPRPSTAQTSTSSASPSLECSCTRLSSHFASKGRSSHFGCSCARTPALFIVIAFLAFLGSIALVQPPFFSFPLRQSV